MTTSTKLIEGFEPPSGEPLGGAIAYGDIDDLGRKQIFLAVGTGTHRRQVTSGPEQNRQPDISPDGSAIVYVSEPGALEIRSIRLDGSDRRTLTFGGLSVAPDWSPDGSRIAYTHLPPGEATPHIWTMAADGSDKRQVTWGAAPDFVPTWAPDGKHIAFFSLRNGGLGQIWVTDVVRGLSHRLTTAYYDEALGAHLEQKVPAWSPDGRYIAYFNGVEMSDPRKTGDVPRDVWVMEADGSNQRRLMTGDDPEWSPDSRTVILPVNIPLEETGLPLGIGAIDVNGSNFRVLMYTNGYFGWASWRSSRAYQPRRARPPRRTFRHQ